MYKSDIEAYFQSINQWPDSGPIEEKIDRIISFFGEFIIMSMRTIIYVPDNQFNQFNINTIFYIAII